MVWSMLPSVLSHAAYAVLMELLLGKAKFKMQHQTGYIIGALALPFIFHFMYDIIQLLSIFSGAWIGLIASLLIIVFLGKQAVDSYQKESPLKKMTSAAKINNCVPYFFGHNLERTVILFRFQTKPSLVKAWWVVADMHRNAPFLDGQFQWLIKCLTEGNNF